MTALNKQALRTAAENATPGEWCADDYHGVIADAGLNENYYIASCSGPDNRANKRFIASANPATVLTLLDENYRLTAERDALRENIGGDNTRAAADIYFQLVEECEIPPGGSLVGYVDDIKERLSNAEKRIAELEARTVNLPKRSVGGVMHMSGFSRDYAEGWCAGNDNAIHKIRAAGIGVKGD
ncbi:TPA: ead/Ea22-like family protein [Citrobacter freundii]|nr:ead/Ea22-like family protein [Citrobacter freundii]HCD1457195.1 ead/Ea22-like family protein [Citrobacter freundii]HCD2016532.1 ead/Ea22-like family protein [Citrobacter freundii]HCD3567906.1 ead/Ea22-like family protein [Citrobacter freundii]HCD4630420.1 ead/Ea22-like family protein [Citrobacter freundii]